MNHYKLIILSADGATGPSGYVFCANDAEARSSAAQLLTLNSAHERVRVYLDDQLVCEVTRDGGLRPMRSLSR
jgi:hypothetical protein